MGRYGARIGNKEGSMVVDITERRIWQLSSLISKRNTKIG